MASLYRVNIVLIEPLSLNKPSCLIENPTGNRHDTFFKQLKQRDALRVNLSLRASIKPNPAIRAMFA